MELDKDIFSGEINQAVLREAVLAYQSNQRQGTACTKTRGEVRGGGRKPWIQKGTGRARAGSIRSPIWVGGGTVFGPKPRSFKYPLSRRIKRLALRDALRKKINEGLFFVLNEFLIEEPKTKRMVEFLNNFSVEGKVLLIVDRWNDNMKKASSNLKNLELNLAHLVCAFDVLACDSVFITKQALAKLEERLKR
ncbi:50S ribosomal protein L4 [Candidatus Aerophobetes bacterium]|uniref:Large ribosomal subunit protein uL4 n=1 Tax=Aerophobetes bacterium TaxID=2030807 RepID=A0A497E6M2_UNCAE|nr:50S ribosomal protein L4 [Candidatus Aerophobetes bacterium]RLE10533.1 MAG: 50S ribosomal protein L4 [Candidatus Aerophobetes bacterium]